MIYDDVEAEEVKKILGATSFRKLAERFGYEESEIEIDWNEFLSGTDLVVYSEDEIKDTTRR